MSSQIPLATIKNFAFAQSDILLDIDSRQNTPASEDNSEYSLINPAPKKLPTIYGPSTHTMSTRRTTRAASRQASSRAVSPAASVATTATPRRNRRAGNEALPAVGLRQSTAYGTNTTAQPARITGPVVSDQINSVLRDLLTPDPHSHATCKSQVQFFDLD